LKSTPSSEVATNVLLGDRDRRNDSDQRTSRVDTAAELTNTNSQRFIVAPEQQHAWFIVHSDCCCCFRNHWLRT